MNEYLKTIQPVYLWLLHDLKRDWVDEAEAPTLCGIEPLISGSHLSALSAVQEAG